MLLPSALSCDGGRVLPSASSILLSPTPRRATRIPLERPSLSLFTSPQANRYESVMGGSAVEGIFSTCKKLHQILSLDTNRGASIPSIVVNSAVAQSHNAFNLAISAPTISHVPASPRRSRRSVSPAASAPRNARSRLSVAPCAIPRTPQPNHNVMRIPKTPMRRNKRRREADSEDEGFYHVPVQENKRTRLTVVPSSSILRTAVNESTSTHVIKATPSSKFNRRCRQLRMNSEIDANSTPLFSSAAAAEMQVSRIEESPIDEEIPEMAVASSSSTSLEDPAWTNAEDRLLVELVLKKLRLSPRDWADCAKSLGRDQRSVGNRWDMIVGKLGGVRDGRVGGTRRKRLE